MKLASLAGSGRDGELAVVSSDGSRYLKPESASTMLEAIERWDAVVDELQSLAQCLAGGTGEPANGVRFGAPLPRSWQWLDGSAFDSHGKLMQRVFGLDPIEYDKPLMYQGMSHLFYGPNDDVPFVREEDGIDFEGEIGVLVDDVPMGVSPEEAIGHIKLVLLINDRSLRAIAPKEMKTGFGWVQAKPACSMAPFAVTPDELGEHWSDGRVRLRLRVEWNDHLFGNAQGGEMTVGFHDLVAHAAATRTLCAGTVIGSGTVSNADYLQIGSSCISERRGIEMLDGGEAKTPFMSFGDSVAMEAWLPDGSSVFGRIHQKVVRA